MDWRRNNMSTFLNPDAVKDGSLSKSKLDAALKTEIENKQDALIAGIGIDITDNKISCTLDTTIFKVVDSLPTAPARGDENKIHLVLSSSSEEGNTYDEYIWVNNSWERTGSFRPSIDLSGYAEKSYVDSQIEREATARTNADAELQTQINGKQEALTLTVKDNGNIVLANIQGQSKEFMPATPSGDPMHYAYVAAGAEYNDTGADIVKTTPWANLADDDADKTVVHKAGYWYLNGLGDITNEQMRIIYSYINTFISSYDRSEALYGSKARTNIKLYPQLGSYGRITLLAAFTESSLEVLNFGSYLNTGDMRYAFRNSKIKYIIGDLLLGTTSRYESTFYKCIQLKVIKIKKLFASLSFGDSPLLSLKSVLYMINNEAATSAITITLHADAYARAMANADILAALEAHPNVSLASA